MTELLYLRDCYMKEFDATVKHAEGNMVELDRTAFYPESGGQLSDTGTLHRGEEEFKVIKARKQGGKVMHEIDREGPKAGDAVQGKIDWAPRYNMMRMHTAAHVITTAVQAIVPDALVTGGQLGFEESRDDYSVPELSQEMVSEIEKKANEIVQAEQEVEIKELPREEAFKLPQLFKLKDVLPPSIPMIRVIQIGKDVNACGGTHVRNTKEIGSIKITRTKSKGANNRRLYFALEG